MARQIEGFLVGTYDDMTFYKMEGKYYARKKSSLTGTKYRTHKSFEGSRRSNGRFGMGNKIASQVYREIPEQEREYELFCKMKSAAIAMIKAGKEENLIIEALRGLKPGMQPGKQNNKTRIRITFPFNKCLFRTNPYNRTYSENRKRSMGYRLNKEHSIANKVIGKALKYKGAYTVNRDLNKQKNRQADPPD